MNGFLVIKTRHHITVDIEWDPYYNILILFPIYFVKTLLKVKSLGLVVLSLYILTRVDSCFRFGVVVRSTVERTKNVCPDDPPQVWIWKTMLSNSNNGRNRLPDGKIEKFRKQAIWHPRHLKYIGVQRYLFPFVWQEVWLRRF